MKNYIYIFIIFIVIIFSLLVVVIFLLWRYKYAIAVLNKLKEEIHVINSTQYKSSLKTLKILGNNLEIKDKYNLFLSNYRKLRETALKVIEDVKAGEELLNKKKIHKFFKLVNPIKKELKKLKQKILEMINQIEEETKDVNEYHEKLNKYQNHYQTIKTYYSNNFLVFESIDKKIKEFLSIIDNSFLKLDELKNNNNFSEMENEFSKLKPAILFIAELFLNFPNQQNLVNFIIPKKYSEIEKKYYDLVKSGCRLENFNFADFNKRYQQKLYLVKDYLNRLQYKKLKSELDFLIDELNRAYNIITSEERYFQNLSSTMSTLTALFKKVQNLKIKFNSIFTEKNKNYHISKDESIVLESIEKRWVHIKTLFNQIETRYKNQQHINIVWTHFYQTVNQIIDEIKQINLKLKEGINFYKQRKSISDYQSEFVQLKQLIFLINTKHGDKNFESFFKTCPHDVPQILKDTKSLLVYLGKNPVLNQKAVVGIQKLRNEINEVYSKFLDYNEEYKTATKLMMKAASLRDRNKQVRAKLPQLEILYATNQYKEVIYILKNTLKL